MKLGNCRLHHIQSWLLVLALCSFIQGCASTKRQHVTYTAAGNAPPAAVSAMPPASALASPAARLHVRFVNVGQGDCTVARFPNGKILMVDCGSTKGGVLSKIRSDVLEVLDPQNPKVDVLVVTHPDADHYNLLEKVLDGVKVSNVYITGSTDEYGTNFGGWLEDLPANVLHVMRPSVWNKTEPKTLEDFGSAKVHVLAADVEDVSVGSVKNTRSIVTKVTYRDFDLIITGDATFDTENSIITRYSGNAPFLDVEVLKLGHHGSRATSTSAEWLSAVKPEWAVVSAGYDNDYGHPSRDVIRRVESHTIDTAPHKLRWSWRENRRSHYELLQDYREAIFSSGSSGTIDLYSDGTVIPVLETEK